MINKNEFSERLQKVMDHYGENASSFAEHIGVQRSSISHILSGRNKPSLDFILKVLASYPEVDLYWLMNGKGEFPKRNIDADQVDSKKEKSTTKNPIISSVDTDSTIDRIVIFYKDGTFKNYNPS